MNTKTKLLFIMFFFVSFFTEACSVFLLKNNQKIVVGSNYDWTIGSGFIVVNKKRVCKKSFVIPPETAVIWKSRYGSITFNQFGRDFPNEGINEKGFFLKVLWLDSTVYEPKDKRSVINELQFVQYSIDNFSNVNDFLKNLNTIRVGQTHAKLHFFAADKYGNTAVIEFINGEIKIFPNDSMKVKVLTNSSYSTSCNYLSNSDLSISKSSLNRFCVINKMLSDSFPKSTPIIVYAHSILNFVKITNYTKWQTVYDLTNLKISYKTDKNRKLKWINLHDFDYNCFGFVKVIDINNRHENNLFRYFKNYSKSKNRKYISQAFSRLEFLREFPKKMVRKIVDYPLTHTNCE